MKNAIIPIVVFLIVAPAATVLTWEAHLERERLLALPLSEVDGLVKCFIAPG